MELESRQIEGGNTGKAVLPELSALDLLKGSSVDKLYMRPEKWDPALDPFMPLPRNIDFSVPLDGSKAKAPPEFISLTPNSTKAGVDGVIETIKDKWAGIFGERDTLHDHVRLLARAGMTPSERQQLAREEQQLKDYNKAKADNPLSKYDTDARPKTPMLDELNRRTTALEKNISETAKKGMTPLQVAQLESGTASSALKSQYENQLIATVAQYERNGSVPKDVYAAVIAGAKKEKILDEQQAAKEQKALETLLSGCAPLPKVIIVDDGAAVKPSGRGGGYDPIIVGRPYKGEEPIIVTRPQKGGCEQEPIITGANREPFPFLKPTHKPSFVETREKGGNGWLGNM